MVFDDDRLSVDDLHQLADFVLPLTNLFQGQVLHQGPKKAQLRPNKFCRKSHWIKSFLIVCTHFIIYYKKMQKKSEIFPRELGESRLLPVE